MKKLILLILLNACFNSPNSKDINRKGTNKKEEEKKEHKKLPEGIKPITLEDGKTYTLIITEEQQEEIMKQMDLLEYENGPTPTPKMREINELKKRFEELISPRLEYETNEEDHTKYTNFLNEMENVKTRKELSDLVYKYDITGRVKHMKEKGTNPSYPPLIFKIKDFNIFKYISLTSENPNEGSKFDYFALKGKLSDDRKSAQISDIRVKRGEKIIESIYKDGKEVGQQVKTYKPKAFKINEISSTDKFEGGIYYIFDIPLQLEEIKSLPNEKILSLEDREANLDPSNEENLKDEDDEDIESIYVIDEKDDKSSNQENDESSEADEQSDEESRVEDDQYSKIIPVALEEGKLYSIRFSNIKGIYKSDPALIKRAKEHFENCKEGYNHQVSDDDKEDFLTYFKKNLGNEILASLNKKLEEAKTEDDIEELIKKSSIADKLVSGRPSAFKIEGGKFKVYVSEPRGSRKEWCEFPGMKDNLNWKVQERDGSEYSERIENGIYYIYDKPFQIVEVEDINEIDRLINSILDGTLDLY